MSKDASTQEKRYVEETGKSPSRLPDDHPDAWQWEYRGSKAERDALAAEFGLRGEEEEPILIDGQEEMF